MIHLVILADKETSIVTDIVAFDDFRRAEEVAAELSAKYGRAFVQRTSVTVNQLPAFWGLNDQAGE